MLEILMQSNRLIIYEIAIDLYVWLNFFNTSDYRIALWARSIFRSVSPSLSLFQADRELMAWTNYLGYHSSHGIKLIILKGSSTEYTHSVHTLIAMQYYAPVKVYMLCRNANFSSSLFLYENCYVYLATSMQCGTIISFISKKN